MIKILLSSLMVGEFDEVLAEGTLNSQLRRFEFYDLGRIIVARYPVHQVYLLKYFIFYRLIYVSSKKGEYTGTPPKNFRIENFKV